MFKSGYYDNNEKAVGGRPPQYAPAPLSLTSDLLTLNESGVRVTCDVGYLCANFSLPRPLCSRVTPDIRDRQRDVRQKHRLMPRLGSRGIIIQENLQWHGGHIKPHDDWQLKVK